MEKIVGKMCLIISFKQSNHYMYRMNALIQNISDSEETEFNVFYLSKCG